MRVQHESRGAGGLIENMKKGLTEMLVLTLLNKRPMHIYEIIRILDEQSDGVCKVAYPYAVIYRLMNSHHVEEAGKRVADDRLRAYYRITDSGREHLVQMQKEYRMFTDGMQNIFAYLDKEEVEG